MRFFTDEAKNPGGTGFKYLDIQVFLFKETLKSRIIGVLHCSLFHGLLVPATDPDSSEKSDWQVLMAWLEKSENASWLAEQCQKHSLSLRDSSGKGFTGSLTIENGEWVLQRSEQEATPVESVQSFLAEAGKTMDLRIEKQLGKADVIEKKQGIADDLASLIEILVPVYSAVADR